MEITKQAVGSNVKEFTYQAIINVKNEKDRAIYD